MKAMQNSLSPTITATKESKDSQTCFMSMDGALPKDDYHWIEYIIPRITRRCVKSGEYYTTKLKQKLPSISHLI